MSTIQSLKRRLSTGWSLNSNDQRNALLEENDDEAEKKRKRIESTPSEDGFNSLEITGKQQNFKKKDETKLSSNQLADLYSSCIKLSSENKINQKNSWALPLIDYIDDVLQIQHVGEMTNFQAASCTLDASVKIYSYRVDSVHNETYKVLGGLNRTDKREESSLEENQDQEENIQDPKKIDSPTKPKPQKLHSVKTGISETIETNPENLNQKKVDLEFSVDPLFKKTSASFDEGKMRGLLLNNLSVWNNCQLIFDSSDAVENGNNKEDKSTPEQKISIDLTHIQEKVKDYTADLPLCSTFSNFKFSNITILDDDEVDFKDVDQEIEEIPMDSDFNLIEGGDEFQDLGSSQEMDVDESINAGIDGDKPLVYPLSESSSGISTNSIPKSDIPEVSVIISNNPSDEYNYFDPKLMQNWAGPSHWKKFQNPRAIPKNKLVISTDSSEGVEGVDGKPKAKRMKKKAFLINFNPDDSLDDILMPFSVDCSEDNLSLASYSGLNSKLEKSSESITTLPTDLHYEVKMLTQLFTKPGYSVSRQKQLLELRDRERDLDQEDEDEVQGLNFQADDSFGVDPLGGTDNVFHEAEGDTLKRTISEKNIEDDQLIAEPTKVQKIDINYDKVAKKIDVKFLKSNIWEEVKTTNTSLSFNKVLEGLPKRLDNSTLKASSVPLCFICLLHLANEHNLSITQNDLTSLEINKSLK